MDFSADDLRRIKHRHGDEPLTMVSYSAVDCTLDDLIDYTAALQSRLAAAERERDALRAALPAEGATGAVAWCLADKHGNLSDAQFVQAHAEQVLAWWNDPARVDRLTNGPYRVVPLYAHPAPADAGPCHYSEVDGILGHATPPAPADAGGVKVWRTPDGAWFGGRPLHMPGDAHVAYPRAQAAAMEAVVEAAKAYRAGQTDEYPRGCDLHLALVAAVDAYAATFPTRAPGGEGGQR